MKITVTGLREHRTVRSVLHWLLSVGVASAMSIAGLTFIAGATAGALPLASATGVSTPMAVSSFSAPMSLVLNGHAASLSTGAARAGVSGAGMHPLVAQVAQAPLTLTSTSGSAGTALTLTSSGGSGTGALTYAITSSGSAGCLISSARLDASRAGTCTVTVTKAGDATYLATSSAATTVTFAPAPPKNQSALTLTSTKGTLGSTLTLSSSGGSGTGALTYAITSSGSAGCLISVNKLSATRTGTCTVTVTKAGDATYLVASSSATTVTFTPAPLKTQSALTLTSTSGTLGSALTLTASGGSGSGALTYAVTSTGTAACWITSGRLNATRTGTCTVTATKAGDAAYLIARSAVTTVTFKVAPVVLTATTVKGIVWVGRTVVVSIIGTGFYGKPTIKSNEARTSAVVIHDNGRELVVRVTLPPGSVPGWHVFTVILANGQSCRVRYLVKLKLTASKVNGVVRIGRTVVVSIIGTGFYSKPTIKSNEARTSAVVIHDYGRQLVVRVTLAPGSAPGWHLFTIILANRQSCRVRYQVK